MFPKHIKTYCKVSLTTWALIVAHDKNKK